MFSTGNIQHTHVNEEKYCQGRPSGKSQEDGQFDSACRKVTATFFAINFDEFAIY